MLLRVDDAVAPPLARGVGVDVSVAWRVGVLVVVTSADGVDVAVTSEEGEGVVVGAREGRATKYVTRGSKEPGMRLTSAAYTAS